MLNNICGVVAYEWATTHLGWRAVQRAMTALLLTVAIPVAVFLRDSPESAQCTVDGLPAPPHAATLAVEQQEEQQEELHGLLQGGEPPDPRTTPVAPLRRVDAGVGAGGSPDTWPVVSPGTSPVWWDPLRRSGPNPSLFRAHKSRNKPNMVNPYMKLHQVGFGV